MQGATSAAGDAWHIGAFDWSKHEFLPKYEYGQFWENTAHNYTRTRRTVVIREQEKLESMHLLCGTVLLTSDTVLCRTALETHSPKITTATNGTKFRN